MTTYVDRSRFLALLRSSNARAGIGRRRTRFEANQVKARMPIKLRAQFLGSMSGGDESTALTRWYVPGVGRGELLVDRVVLGKLVASAEPRSPPPPADVAQRQDAARARLRDLRPALAPMQAKLL
jgi:hypothetical protein